MYLGLSLSDVPANAIVPVDGSESKLVILWLELPNGIIRANAFENLNNLKNLKIQSNVKTVEKEAFHLSKKSDLSLEIRFYASSLTGQSFQAGAFDGSQRPLVVYLDHINIDYLPEEAFKSVLYNNQNQLSMLPSIRRGHSYLNCEDCRNAWLIKNTQHQLANAFCHAGLSNQKLYDADVISKFNQKCK